ncbi:hypothetical protein [Bifidobacterium cuniculi]|uniref:Putative growth arrest and DNA-damage-inducible proteins-interacting protein 1 n=1 Tax=Bifidobacterium cuniculi TaxID=1688 RepID=A0A087B3Z5_9BIFI|nr:hypothetical protein [Bifidobacterium cuniculi]KFI65745.1 putative growth arrest and DNA-damage-inducible proteins-interacting protein 1 [Bifidobacterium cuniculi]
MGDEQFPGHHDDSRTRQPSKPRDHEKTVDAEGAEAPTQTGPIQDGDADTQGSGKQELDKAVSDKDVVELLQLLGLSESYSGLLPQPKFFNQYPKDVQERMCRWNDAFTVDESKRQDRLVDAEIDQGKKSMWISAILFGICIIVSLVCFLVTKDAWSIAFLSVPVVSMVLNIFVPVGSKSSRDKSSRGRSEDSSSA